MKIQSLQCHRFSFRDKQNYVIIYRKLHFLTFEVERWRLFKMQGTFLREHGTTLGQVPRCIVLAKITNHRSKNTGKSLLLKTTEG